MDGESRAGEGIAICKPAEKKLFFLSLHLDSHLPLLIISLSFDLESFPHSLILPLGIPHVNCQLQKVNGSSLVPHPPDYA